MRTQPTLFALVSVLTLAVLPDRAEARSVFQARVPSIVARAARQGIVVNVVKTGVKAAGSLVVTVPVLFGAALGNDGTLAAGALVAGGTLLTMSARDIWSRLGWRRDVSEPRRGLGFAFRGLTRATVAVESAPLIPVHLVSNVFGERKSFAARFGN